MSSTAARRFCSPRAWPRHRRRAHACSPGRDGRARRGRLLRNRRAARPSRALGRAHVEFDQTGPPPRRRRPRLVEAPANPMLTMPDFEAAAAHAAPVVCDATAATPLHVRPLDAAATSRSTARRSTSAGTTTCSPASSSAGDRDRRAPARVPLAGRARSPRPTPPGCSSAGSQTLEARVARQTETRSRARRAASVAPGGRRPSATRASAALSRSTSPTQMRRIASRPRTRLIAERDEPGGAPRSSKRARAGKATAARRAAPVLGRPRGRRGALGGPRAGARERPA